MQKPSKVSPPEPEVVLPAPVQASPPPAKLQARTPAPPQAQPETPRSDSFFRYHQVQKGETLDAIAKRYKTDAQTLRELNDLAANEGVRPGDRIIVGQK
jgi:LysM repeat protein